MKFNKVYIDKNIFYIEDFIDKESILVLQDEIRKQSLKVEESRGLYHDVLSLNTEKCQLIWDKITRNLNDLFTNDKEILHNFNIKPTFIKYVNREAKLTRWAMYPHSDNNEYESNDNSFSGTFPNIVKGLVIYITDDYEGGEIVYINKNIEIKPKAGYLVCHPGSEEYTHGVKSFSGGPRIIISAFVHEIQKPN
jgi:hypothetical protein